MGPKRQRSDGEQKPGYKVDPVASTCVRLQQHPELAIGNLTSVQNQ